MSDIIAFLLSAACFTTHKITSYDLVSLRLRFFLALVCLMTTLSGRPWTSTWLLWINQHQKLLSYNKIFTIPQHFCWSLTSFDLHDFHSDTRGLL